MEVKQNESFQLEEWNDQQGNGKRQSGRNYFWFIAPSLLGVLLFLFPIPYDGKITIGVGIMAEAVQANLEPILPSLMTGILVISAILPVIAKTLKPKFIIDRPFIKQLFYVNTFWMVTRMIGAIFALMTLFSIGPAFIISDVTGGTMLYSLVPVLAAWFLFAGILMPLLMEFGLMDFIGTMLRKVMRPVFKLPGRSSIDALASWMGAGTVGVLITTKQYEEGYYTKREAATIATNFSINSIAFSLVVISFIGLEEFFVPFYLTVVIAGLVAAFICPRIPPLSKKADTYYEGTGMRISEDTPEGMSNFQWGLNKALSKASEVKGVKYVARQGVQTVLDIYFALIPLVMALGTVALIIAEFTPFFNYLFLPIVPVLQWMQIPEAAQAAPAMLVGFADMFLPAVIGAGIESELTRFVIAAISLTQLIYMSEIGILLVKSKIPISVGELAVIFLQRTVITLPIIVIIAHFIF
ncbi:nucleoside recognition GATE domain-containing membrane protein YjiH [Halobacillus alkaliphilus]|uniref:Nucleoside recognition GATE domain-containing membrane protein YjiH n=1 Tax=Halobacillus alkaliphilus TaxID=396056 RepID=A0A1I2PSP8_9BACI|nr:YjiH family protein [Halobacillus alkaliphilus]SFG18650.1 nucleoside recognition GATE domain-containing membrane protein YjiH [Halobacillus alkaliphilus]